MKVIAFSPAHITGFFQIFIDENEEMTGSTGAGISISLGSYVEVKKSKKFLISKKAKIVRETIKMIGRNFEIRIKNELPISQGFGISGASALAAALAACHIYNIPYEKAIEYAHIAEVRNKTGLGDVIASFYGGMEARIIPGLKGKIKKWNVNEKILMGIIGKKIETKDIISNEKIVDRINEIGGKCLKEFLKKPSFYNFLYLSKIFSEEISLNEKILKILKKLNKIDLASICMIGNSIFSRWSKKMKKAMLKYGKVYEAYIDNYGARIIASIS